MKKITAAEFHAEMKAQGAQDRQDIAFKCVACGTVQSIRSLVNAGLTAEQAESRIGFACEGRQRGAKGAVDRAPADPEIRGCNWSLGGLFHIHKVEVTTPDGKVHPTFELATSEEMDRLRSFMEGSA